MERIGPEVVDRTDRVGDASSEDALIDKMAKIFSLRLDAAAPVEHHRYRCFSVAHLACEEGEWVKIHQAGSALLTLRNASGRTLFVSLAEEGEIEAVRELLNRFTDGISGEERIQAFHLACAQGHLPLIALLYESVFIDSLLDSKTPLATAIEAGQSEVVELLLKNEASLSIGFNEDGIRYTPVTYAIRKGELGCLALLLRSSCSYRRRIPSIGNLLHIAIHFGQAHILEHLLRQELVPPLIEDVNNAGQTPVTLAASLGDVHALSLLRNHVNQPDHCDNTPMHSAALSGSVNAIRLLFRLGASLTKSNAQGKKPSDLAEGPARALLRNLELKKRKIDRENPNFLLEYPENLVFWAGDSMAYLGALEALQVRGVLTHVRRIAADSTSALVGTLLALGYPLDECPRHVRAWDPRRAPQKRLRALLEEVQNLPLPQLRLQRLLAEEAYLPPVDRKGLESLVRAKTGIENCTLGQLATLASRDDSYKELHLFGWDVDRGQIVHFDPADPVWNSLVIADALALCLAIPGLHAREPLQFKDGKDKCFTRADLGDFCDAGLLQTRLMETFDYAHYLGREGEQPTFNRRTLGLGMHQDISSSDSPWTLVELCTQHAALAYEYNQNRLIVITTTASSDMERRSAGRQATVRFLPSADQDPLIELPELNVKEKCFPAVSPHFAGREGCLEELVSAFRASADKGTVRRVLLGPPGQGKSELAKAFATQSFDQYSVIYWIAAETDETCDLAYRDLAAALNVKLKLTDHPDDIRRRVFRALRRLEKPYLLIYDGVQKRVEHPERGGHILITSRNKRLWHASETISVPDFTVQEAGELLQKTTGRKPTNIKALIARLGPQPFVLDMAARYIAQEGLSVESYLRELKDPLALKALMDLGGGDYAPSLDYAWSLSLSRLTQQAQEWLYLCSMLAPDKIPQHWIEKWLQFEKNLKPPQARLSARRCCQELADAGLVRHDKRSKSLFLQSLLSDFLLSTGGGRPAAYNQTVSFALKSLAAFQKSSHLSPTSADFQEGKVWLTHLYWLLQHTPPGADPKLKAKLAETISCIEMLKGSLFASQQVIINYISPHFDKPERPTFNPPIEEYCHLLKAVGRYKESVDAFMDAVDRSTRMVVPSLEAWLVTNRLGEGERRRLQRSPASEALEELRCIVTDDGLTDVTTIKAQLICLVRLSVRVDASRVSLLRSFDDLPESSGRLRRDRGREIEDYALGETCTRKDLLKRFRRALDAGHQEVARTLLKRAVHLQRRLQNEASSRYVRNLASIASTYLPTLDPGAKGHAKLLNAVKRYEEAVDAFVDAIDCSTRMVVPGLEAWLVAGRLKEEERERLRTRPASETFKALLGITTNDDLAQPDTEVTTIKGQLIYLGQFSKRVDDARGSLLWHFNQVAGYSIKLRRDRSSEVEDDVFVAIPTRRELEEWSKKALEAGSMEEALEALREAIPMFRDLLKRCKKALNAGCEKEALERLNRAVRMQRQLQNAASSRYVANLASIASTYSPKGDSSKEARSWCFIQ